LGDLIIIFDEGIRDKICEFPEPRSERYIDGFLTADGDLKYNGRDGFNMSDRVICMHACHNISTKLNCLIKIKKSERKERRKIDFR
jgi:hypothetical protein